MKKQVKKLVDSFHGDVVVFFCLYEFVVSH